MCTGTAVDLQLLHSKAVAVLLIYELRIKEKRRDIFETYFRDSAAFVIGLE